MASTSKVALALGATGGIGGETTSALARHGWRIRALARAGAPAGDKSGWDWVKGDSMDRTSILSAAEGVHVIVHGVNPPGYRNWSKLVIPMMENTILAAQSSGARILLPGTIYNYGPDAWPVLREDSPQHATTHKGTIRIALEQRLKEASQRGVRSLIVRFGDFFGPKPGNNWFSQGMVKPHQPIRSVSYPGEAGIGHDWAYLPDAGETFAQLLEKETELDQFARFHFRGHWDSDGTQMVASVRKAANNPSISVKSMPWWLFKVGSVFNETIV